MTCVVGLVENGVGYIGVDSLGSNNFTKTIREDSKVFKMKDTDKGIIGYTSSFRMGQLLQYAGGLVDKRDEPNINHEYLVTKFIPNIRNLFSSQGYERNNSGEAQGGSFLLVYDDKLYHIQSDYQVGIPVDGYDACGSGEYHANAALFATEGLDMKPEERIVLALRAAQKFVTSVEAPFHIMNTKDNSIMTFDRDGNFMEVKK